MNTGGKIALGVLVPLAVGGAAVAAYFYFRETDEQYEEDTPYYDDPIGPLTRSAFEKAYIIAKYKESLARKKKLKKTPRDKHYDIQTDRNQRKRKHDISMSNYNVNEDGFASIRNPLYEVENEDELDGGKRRRRTPTNKHHKTRTHRRRR